MSQTEPDAVTVSQAGFTVTKTLNTEDFQTLAIMFEITADPETSGRLVLRDTIPEDLPLDDVGFHPDYGAEYWTAEGQEIVFEREFEPGEEYTTIYGLRNYDLSSMDGPLNDPVLEVPDADTEPPADDVNDDPETAAESAPEPADRDVTAEEEDAETADASGPEAPGPEDEPDPDGAPSTDDTEPTTVPSAGGVGRVLAKELRENRLAEEDRQALREELLAEPQSTVVRLEHLESRVSELDAYTDALEEFIDEHGAKEVLDDIDEELTAVRDDVEVVQEDVGRVEDHMEALEARMDDLEAEIEQVDDVASDVDRLEEEIDEIYDELDDLAEFRERLSSALGSYGGGAGDEE